MSRAPSCTIATSQLLLGAIPLAFEVIARWCEMRDGGGLEHYFGKEVLGRSDRWGAKVRQDDGLIVGNREQSQERMATAGHRARGHGAAAVPVG